MTLIVFLNNICISNSLIGRIKQLFYNKLQKILKFDKWHITPINRRPYAVDIVKYINSFIKENGIKNEDYIIEIGCGLGDIIGNIIYPANNKLGLDLDERIIAGAKIAHPCRAVFHKGSFHSVSGKNIIFLITVNFIHNIPPEELKNFYSVICKKNYIRFIILDTVISKAYTYSHKGEHLLKNIGYVKVKRTKAYSVNKGIRIIEIWERIGQ